MLNDPRLQNDYKLNRETDRMQGPAKYAALLSEQVSTRAKSLGQASGAIGPDAGQNVQSRFNNANKYKNEGNPALGRAEGLRRPFVCGWDGGLVSARAQDSILRGHCCE